MAPKKQIILPESITSIKAYNDYLNNNRVLETLIDNLNKNFPIEEFTEERILQTVMSANRQASPSAKTLINRFIKDNQQASKNIKYYSGKDSAKRELLSKKALEAFAKSFYSLSSIKVELRKLTDKNHFTEDEYQELSSKRDFSMLLFNYSKDNSPKTIQKKADYFLCKDLDSKKLPKDTLKDIKDKRWAEALNESLRVIASFDYTKADNLSDAELVANWGEIRRHLLMLSTVRAELGKTNSYKNKYLDQKLLKKCLEIEATTNGMRDTSLITRMELIANPYYKELDPEFLLNIDPGFCDTFAYTDINGSNVYFDRFKASAKDFAGLYPEYSINNIIAEFNKSVVIKDVKDLLIVDLNGKQIKDLSMLRSSHPFFAAPLGHPELLKVFDFDISKHGVKALDSKPYQEKMDTIRGKMKDRVAEDKAFLAEFVNGAAKVTGYLESGGALSYRITGLYTNQVKTINGVSNPLDVHYLRRCLSLMIANPRPKTSREAFDKLIGVEAADSLTDAEVEERRQLTEKAIDKFVEVTQMRVESNPISGNEPTTDFNFRIYKAVMFRLGKENAAKNKEVYQAFFGLDENDKPKGVSKEELDETRNTLIHERLLELKSIAEKLNQKILSDSEIVANYKDIFELTLAMELEWKSFSSAVGSFSDANIEIINQIQPIASKFQAYYTGRMDYISNTYYQFGNEEKLALNAEKLMGMSEPALSTLGTITVTVRGSQEAIVAEQFKAIIKNQNSIDYIYGGDGYPITKTKEDVAKALHQGKEVYVFSKGDMTPTVLKMSDENKSVLEAVPMTKERNNLARVMRTNVALERLMDEAIQTKAPNPQRYVDQMSIYIMKQYGIALLADGLDGLEGAERDAQMKSLRGAMCEYLALAVIKNNIAKMQDAGALKEEVIAKLIDRENIKTFADALGKSKAVDMLLDDMLNDPNKQELFEHLDEKKLVKGLSEKQAVINKEEELARKESREQFKEKSYDLIKSTAAFDYLRSKEYWGYDVNDATSKNVIDGLSVSRTAVSTFSLGYLVTKGYGVEEIYANTPEMKQLRSEASAHVIDCLSKGDVASIAKYIGEGSKACNDYLDNKFKSGEIKSYKDILKKENIIMASLSPTMKDFYQEYGTLKQYVGKQGLNMKDISNEAWEKEIDRTEGFSAALYAHTDGIIRAVSCLDNGDANFNDVVFNAAGQAIQTALTQAYFQYLAQLTENVGKPINELYDGESAAYMPVLLETFYKDKQFKAFKDKVTTNPEYAEKTLMAIMDGSLVESLNMKLNSITDIEGEMPVFDLSCDFDKFNNNIKIKDTSQLKDFGKLNLIKAHNEKKQSAPQKAVDPKQKLQKINKQLEKNQQKSLAM